MSTPKIDRGGLTALLRRAASVAQRMASIAETRDSRFLALGGADSLLMLAAACDMGLYDDVEAEAPAPEAPSE